jgi:short-subunit dehydrogenase
MEAADFGIGTTIIYPPDTITPFLKWEQENTLPECRALSKNAKAIPAEEVAKKLVEAMIKNKFEVFCSRESKLIRILKVTWPSFYFNMIDGIVKKDRKKRGVI